MLQFPAGRLIAALIWAGAMAGSSASFAEIYKWVDQKGVTNYSSASPASGKAQTLDPAKVTVSVYQTTAPQDAARLDALMRQKVALLENQLRAERMARLSQQTSYQTDADRYRLAYEQCLTERRVDCDAGRDGMRATPYYYAPAAPVFVVRRPFPSTPFPVTGFTPFPRNRATVSGTMVRYPRPAGAPTRTADRLSRKFR